ncbi:hypothetical protein EXM65_12915 [Clostridium botulinum]|uniref:Uncharacterized protein n=1 Tax=Clostridium botulinum TaxID=1491 RepID=A0A6M0SQ85_CLOBO|nr:hypothetical protein [Clostridium botulinum]
MKKLLEKVKYCFIMYIRVWQKKGTGMTNFTVNLPGRIIVPTRELKKQEKYILENKFNEKEANDYRRKEVFSYCNSIKVKI